MSTHCSTHCTTHCTKCKLGDRQVWARTAEESSRTPTFLACCKSMAQRHRPCYGGWDATDMEDYDPVWRVDFSIHFFGNGALSCSILPICCADGRSQAWLPPAAPEPIEPHAETSDMADLAAMLTVIITSSPIRSNPGTRMIQECIASLDLYGGLASADKLIMCDGFKLRSRSQLKLGVATDTEAQAYRAFVGECAALCRSDPAFRRSRVVRLARRQGSAFAIKEAIQVSPPHR